MTEKCPKCHHAMRWSGCGYAKTHEVYGIDCLRRQNAALEAENARLLTENDRLRTFPRQEDKRGGWTIDVGFIRKVSERCRFGVGWEEIEEALLAIEEVRAVAAAAKENTNE